MSTQRKAIKTFNRTVKIGDRFTLAREDSSEPLMLEVSSTPFVAPNGQAYAYCKPPGMSRVRSRAIPIEVITYAIERYKTEMGQEVH